MGSSSSHWVLWFGYDSAPQPCGALIEWQASPA